MNLYLVVFLVKEDYNRVAKGKWEWFGRDLIIHIKKWTVGTKEWL